MQILSNIPMIICKLERMNGGSSVGNEGTAADVNAYTDPFPRGFPTGEYSTRTQ